MGIQHNISIFSWIYKTSKFIAWHRKRVLNKNINQLLTDYILDQKIQWKSWTRIFFILMKIGHSTDYFNIFLDLQDLQIYSLTSQERAEQEYKSTFNWLYPGSKDTVKIVKSKYSRYIGRLGIQQNISIFSWIYKTSKFIAWHRKRVLNKNINQLLTDYILDQKIHWKSWTRNIVFTYGDWVFNRIFLNFPGSTRPPNL